MLECRNSWPLFDEVSAIVGDAVATGKYSKPPGARRVPVARRLCRLNASQICRADHGRMHTSSQAPAGGAEGESDDGDDFRGDESDVAGFPLAVASGSATPTPQPVRSPAPSTTSANDVSPSAYAASSAARGRKRLRTSGGSDSSEATQELAAVVKDAFQALLAPPVPPAATTTVQTDVSRVCTLLENLAEGGEISETECIALINFAIDQDRQGGKWAEAVLSLHGRIQVALVKDALDKLAHAGSRQ